MIAVDDLVLRQGAFSLQGIRFAVPTGSYGILMGKTGSGKTSILEAIAGLRPIVEGRIVLGDKDVSKCSPAERGIGYVPQDAALFSTMTIRDHLAFALMIRKESPSAIEKRVRELADWLEITHLLYRRSAGLSGGEAQRVALGRALSFRPRFLLMDEPLSSLDETTRGLMVSLLNDIRKQGDVTILHVTHSSHEAGQLGDVRFQLEDGSVREVT